MTLNEFRSAFGAMSLAITHPHPHPHPPKRKPKSLVHASRSYGLGAKAKPRHMKEIASMSLNELFDLSYKCHK